MRIRLLNLIYYHSDSLFSHQICSSIFVSNGFVMIFIIGFPRKINVLGVCNYKPFSWFKHIGHISDMECFANFHFDIMCLTQQLEFSRTCFKQLENSFTKTVTWELGSTEIGHQISACIVVILMLTEVMCPKPQRYPQAYLFLFYPLVSTQFKRGSWLVNMSNGRNKALACDECLSKLMQVNRDHVVILRLLASFNVLCDTYYLTSVGKQNIYMQNVAQP